VSQIRVSNGSVGKTSDRSDLEIYATDVARDKEGQQEANRPGSSQREKTGQWNEKWQIVDEQV
jgi:hypothetical protein